MGIRIASLRQSIAQDDLRLSEAETMIEELQHQLHQISNPTPAPRTPWTPRDSCNHTPRTRSILDMPVSPPDRMQTLSVYGPETRVTLADVSDLCGNRLNVVTWQELWHLGVDRRSIQSCIEKQTPGESHLRSTEFVRNVVARRADGKRVYVAAVYSGDSIDGEFITTIP